MSQQMGKFSDSADDNGLLRRLLLDVYSTLEPIWNNRYVWFVLNPKESIVHPILEFVLLIVHYLWIVYETACWIQWEISDMYLFFSRRKLCVSSLVPSLRKVPKHLGIIVRVANPYDLPEKYFTVSELYDVIIWARCAGIEHINLYDPQGYYVGRRTSIQNMLKRLNVSVMTAIEKQTRKNGILPDDYLHELLLLNKSDGKAALVNAIKSLIKTGQSVKTSEDKTNNLANITSEEIEYAVNIFGDGVCDPDMIIHVGNGAVSLEGYPPWHVRLTEIFQLHPWKRLTENEFCNFLCKFSKCEQRVGK